MPAARFLPGRSFFRCALASLLPLAGIASARSSSVAPPADASAGAPADGLIARYDFDEGEGTVLHDRSGHGFDGLLHGGARWGTGVKGGALDFDGKDGYVQLPADSAFLLGSFTIVAWVMPADQGREGEDTFDHVIYSNALSTVERATAGTEFRFRYNQLEGVSAGAAYNGDWSDMFAPAATADGAWHMVAFSVAGGAGKLWIDGVQAGSTASWRPIPQPVSQPVIGAALRNWASQGYFHGRIDEMRIYDRGLSAAEIAATYAALGGKPVDPKDKGLIARYDFDENAGTALHDRSGHGFDGTLKGGAQWKSGVRGSSLYFNGEDAYVQLPADSAFNAPSFTLAAWIQPTEQGTGADERVLYSNLAYTEGNAVTQGTEFRFRRGELEGVTGRVIWDGDYWSDMFRPAFLADGAWHHVAFSVTGGYGRLWIDGSQAGPAEPWGAIAYPSPLPQIGACLRNEATAGWFHGRIDEMRIYGRGLAAAEIAGLYDENRAQPTRFNLGMNKAYGNPGDTVWAPVRLAALGAVAISACQFVLRADSTVARLIGVKTDSGLARDWALQGWNAARKDSVPVALAGAALPLGESEGELIRFGFEIPKDAPPGASTALTLENVEVDDKEAVAITTVPGRITVSKPAALKGDVNHDGKVDLFDAKAILAYVVGLLSAADPDAKLDTSLADVSGNGAVSSYDAALVFQYGLGLIGSFPSESLAKRAASTGTDLVLSAPASDTSRGFLYSLSGSGLLGLAAGEFRFKLDDNVIAVKEVTSSLYSNRAQVRFDPQTHILEVATVGDIALPRDASELLHITVTAAPGKTPGPMILQSAYLNEGRLSGPGFTSAPLRSSGSEVRVASRRTAPAGARLAGHRMLFADLAGAPARLQAFDSHGRLLWSQAWDHAPAAYTLPEGGWPRGMIWIRLSAPQTQKAWLHLVLNPK